MRLLCRTRDRRRSCAKPSHSVREDWTRFNFFGDVSVHKTERYLGCKQRIRKAVNDHIGIERSDRSTERIGDFSLMWNTSGLVDDPVQRLMHTMPFIRPYAECWIMPSVPVSESVVSAELERRQEGQESVAWLKARETASRRSQPSESLFFGLEIGLDIDQMCCSTFAVSRSYHRHKREGACESIAAAQQTGSLQTR